MKRKILFFIILSPLIFSGCFGYLDMNKINFIASAIIDEDESGSVTFYGEIFSGSRGETTQGATSKRIILSGEGATINQAFYTMQRASNFPMSYDVQKSLIFTERAASYGLTDHLDTIFRNQKPVIKQFLFILEGDPEEFYSIELEDEQFIGIFLEDMMVMQGDQEEILPIRLNEFYNDRIKSGKISLIPTIALCQQPRGMRVGITGAAILQNDKMVAKLDPKEVISYKLISDEIEQGNFTIENPEDPGDMISLLVLDNKTKRDIVYDGEKATFKIQIETTTSVFGLEGELMLMGNEEKIARMTSEEIEERLKGLFDKFQELGIDLFHIESEFKRHYPHVDAQNILENAEIEIDIKIEIESGQNITDFQR